MLAGRGGGGPRGGPEKEERSVTFGNDSLVSFSELLVRLMDVVSKKQTRSRVKTELRSCVRFHSSTWD